MSLFRKIVGKAEPVAPAVPAIPATVQKIDLIALIEALGPESPISRAEVDKLDSPAKIVEAIKGLATKVKEAKEAEKTAKDTQKAAEGELTEYKKVPALLASIFGIPTPADGFAVISFLKTTLEEAKSQMGRLKGAIPDFARANPTLTSILEVAAREFVLDAVLGFERRESDILKDLQGARDRVKDFDKMATNLETAQGTILDLKTKLAARDDSTTTTLGAAIVEKIPEIVTNALTRAPSGGGKSKP